MDDEILEWKHFHILDNMCLETVYKLLDEFDKIWITKPQNKTPLNSDTCI